MAHFPLIAMGRMKHRIISKGSPLVWLCVFLPLTRSENIASANGIYGNGIGADAMSMGGAEVAWAADPLSAMTANPAGLGFLSKPELDLGAEGAVLEGNFTKAGSGGGLNSSLNALPEGAFAYPLKQIPLTFGISVAPQSALLANWHYNDPPGGLGGVTYGYQQDKSEILLLRSALGVGWQINSKLSIGASAGLLYNENKLVAPYIFQDIQSPTVSSPPNGAKTLLNLHTTGFGGDATVGILFRATTNLQFGAFYQSESIINSTGNASGNPSAQFPSAPPGALAFNYDAEVKNKFPQNASAGVSWGFLPKFRVSAQVDWIDWAHAFDTLHISMSNGSNSGVNGVLGASFRDNVPLNWSSEFVYRVGFEYDVTENLSLRLGYCYGSSPVPDATLTPMTAAITEHTITCGAGYHWGRYKVDIAYQYYLPATQNVGQSGLLSGEYSNSSTTMSAHVVALTMGVTF
jgi:long-chain fatty acid transport protein